MNCTQVETLENPFRSLSYPKCSPLTSCRLMQTTVPLLAEVTKNPAKVPKGDGVFCLCVHQASSACKGLGKGCLKRSKQGWTHA